MQEKRDRREYNQKWHLAHKESENAGSRAYYAAHTDECKQMVRDWRKANPEKVKEFKHNETQRNLPRELGKIIAWKRDNPERAREADREYRRKVKQEFVDAYGGKCSCCGIAILEFLTCEHLKKDGSVDRKKHFLGIKMYLKAKREGYPKDRYTALCMNCNFAERHGKICPHKAMKLRQQISLVDDEGLRAIAG